MAAILAVITAGLTYAGPLFIARILTYINKEHASKHDKHTATTYAVMWFVCYLIRIFCNENVNRLCNNASIRTDQIINLLVYDKMMCLSGTYRRFLKKGEFITHFNVRTKIICNFIKSSGALFSAPTTLIMAIIFVFIQVGAYGAVLPVVIVISLVLQIIIDLKMAKLLLKKFKHYNERLICNLEMLSSYKQLKSLGWEGLLSKKNKELRQRENYYNLRAYILNSIYSFLVGFMPALAILLIFVIDIAVEGHSKFATLDVFTIISYIGLISSPLNSLPSTITLLLQTIETCHRIDHFLGAEETIPPISAELQPGAVRICQLFARWDSDISNKHY